MDAADMNVLRYGASILELNALGIPVKDLLDLILLCLVTFGVCRKTCQFTWGACSWAFRKPLPHETLGLPAVAQEPESPAYRECVECLGCEEPVYDRQSHTLMCDGLNVHFPDERQGSTPSKVVLNPGVGGEGTDATSVLDPEELRLVYDAATQLRLEVIQRDRSRTNYQAAAQMRTARYRAMAASPTSSAPPQFVVEQGGPVIVSARETPSQAPKGCDTPPPLQKHPRNVPTIGKGCK